jgi:uncharacterized protein (TIGR02246 family)
MSSTTTTPEQLPIAFQNALNAGDVDAVLALFAPGASMRTVEGEQIAGEEALRAEIAGTVAAHGKLTNTQRHTLIGAQTALLITDWTMEIDAPDGRRITPSGTTANIASRDGNGTWRFAVLNPLGTN